MSRWTEKLTGGAYNEEIYDRDGCKKFINEGCFNYKSELCLNLSDMEEKCKGCPYFEPEEETDETD